MPLDTLQHMVQEEWDFPADVTHHLIQPTDITEIIRVGRLLDPDRVWAAINTADASSGLVNVNDTTGQVTFALTDTTGLKQVYGHRYTYYLWPDPPAVYVGGVLVAPANYTWRPFSMSLEFALPLVASLPLVTVVGHLVDMQEVYARAGNMLLTKYSQLSNVKGNEFDRLAANTAKRVAHYNAGIIRRPLR